MKVFGMGMPELLIILAVILLIFAALGKTVKGLRDGLGGDKKEAVEEEEDDEPATVKALEGDADEEAPAPKKRVKKVVKANA